MAAEKPAWAKLLERPAVRRTIGAALLALLVWFVASTLSASRHADACADRLVAAVGTDPTFVGEAVKNPSQRARLSEASGARLEFVRPISTEWTRVGLMLEGTQTATAALIRLILDAKNTEECVFLLDYEG